MQGRCGRFAVALRGAQRRQASWRRPHLLLRDHRAMHAPPSVSDATPILIGAGQVSEKPGPPGARRRSPTDLAADAARAACDDALGLAALAPHIDALFAVRTMADSQPAPLRARHAPFGGPDKVPRAIARRLGIDPALCVYSLVCGAEPQRLVSEACARLASGELRMMLLTGGEAISNTRAAVAAGEALDWHETDDGPCEDRRDNIGVLRTRHMIDHGMLAPSTVYPLLEQARRARLGLSREAYAQAMGELMAPFSRVAAANPHAASARLRTAEAIATAGPDNRMIADPHPISVVARDQVNLGAALVLTTVGLARQLGVPSAQWVYLHGHSAVEERMVLERQDLGASPAMAAAYAQALASAGVGIADIRHLDLYSCFPIAVFTAMDALGLRADDPRRLTLTGGLPYFGGPGNNYSLHALVEVVQRCRAEPGSLGLVGANGGLMSVHAVGVYSTTPRDFTPCDSGALQHRINTLPAPPFTRVPDGWARVESYTVLHDRQGPSQLIIVGRLEHTDERFIAVNVEGDHAILEAFAAQDGLQHRLWVRGWQGRNVVAISPQAMDAQVPPRRLTLRPRYEHLLVERRGHVLEVTINRPDVRNALTPEANDELEQVFDAFDADATLWVAILTGAGTRAFCAGNDLKASVSGRRIWMPRTGYGGLTARPQRRKPVIAAVNGFALGGGFEIALACDLVVADESAQFALSEPRIGMVAGAGGVQRLMRQVTTKQAMGLLLTGRRATAAEGLAMGFVNDVVPAGTALDGARRWAAQILECSPMAVRATKALVLAQSDHVSEADAVLAGYAVIDRLQASEDRLEGLAAFAEKRKPRWANR
jgi:acetyl-CoA C-acetyltransferase